MVTLDSLLHHLGDEVEDASEETFLLFSTSTPPPSQNLGIINAQPTHLPLSTAHHDFLIHQNPSVLNSARAGGTTGAVVWKITPKFGDWISSPKNLLFETGVLDGSSIVLELGAGIAGVVPVLLGGGGKVGRYLATDQEYALKLLRENIETNLPAAAAAAASAASGSKKGSRKGKVEEAGAKAGNISVAALDWENDDVASFLVAQDIGSEGVDLVLACDCVYNYALIEPFVQCCVDVCRVRKGRQGSGDGEEDKKKPTVCLVAQQLRQPDVFEEWLEVFYKRFRTWRVPDEALGTELGEGSGFVVHLGILRD